MEIVVTILTALVTVLIGWQIYTVIDIRNQVRKMAQAEIAKAVDALGRKAYEYRCESIGTALYNIAEYEFDNGAYHYAFKCMLRALCELHQENPASVEVTLCFSKLQYFIAVMRQKEVVIRLPKYVRLAHLNDLLKIEDDRKNAIVDYIMDEIDVS